MKDVRVLDIKFKHRFAERIETHGAGGNAVHRQRQQTTEQAADGRQQRAFDDEAGENRASAETQHAQGADFPRARADAGIHGVHRGEDRADRHGRGEEIAENFYRHGGHRLVGVIFDLRRSQQRQTPVGLNP